MYNSRYVSRTGRTLHRRKVDTGIAIDPSKVEAYRDYLLNNGYVQLPQPTPPAPSPDGSYTIMPSPSIDVEHLVSTQIFAEDFITSVLSSQGIFLNGNETVYMELQTTVSRPKSSQIVLDIFNQAPTTAPFITTITFNPDSTTNTTFNIAFIYCSGRYSIVFRGSTYRFFDYISVSKSSNQPASSTRSYIAFGPGGVTLHGSVLSIITIGQDSE